uniref:Rh50-like protein n=2 Tax=Latimeria chalumnae TaxID=7897 RepID=H3A386_LATCH
SPGLRFRLPFVIILFQAIFLTLFSLFVTYNEHTDAAAQTNETDHSQNELYEIFPLFQDIQVMIFIGFGFLMAFMKQYGFAGVAFNFLTANFAIQWALLVQGFFNHYYHGKIHIGIYNLINAEFACATVLISLGAVLGKVSPIQLLVLALFEIPIYVTTEWTISEYLKISDVGGSMVLHVFACYFGMSVTRVLYRPGLKDGHSKEKSSYQSDLLAMMGTIFLWIFWPSFNSALANRGDDQHRAVIHTYIALSSCTLTTFALTSMVEKKGKINMALIENATLAGGVAVGTSVDMMVTPGGAFILGCIASVVCTLGFKYLTPFLAKHLKIQDQCGIHNLHGIPGIVGAIGGIITILLSSEDTYGLSLYETFPHRAPAHDDPKLSEMVRLLPVLKAGAGRSASEQALYQAATLGVSIGASVLGGFLTGLVLKLPILAQLPDEHCFDDEPYFEVPELEEKELNQIKISSENCEEKLRLNEN